MHQREYLPRCRDTVTLKEVMNHLLRPHPLLEGGIKNLTGIVHVIGGTGSNGQNRPVPGVHDDALCAVGGSELVDHVLQPPSPIDESSSF